LWANDFTDRVIDLGFWRGDIPTTWVPGPQSADDLRVHARARAAVGCAGPPRRGIIAGCQMALGCAFVTLASVVLSVGAWLSTGDKTSAWWLVGYFTLATIGEHLVAPIAWR
jgi:hypothetical protein